MDRLQEAKLTGRGWFTDAGTIVTPCRKEARRRLLPYLNAAVGLECNAHFLDVALARRFRITHWPVTHHNRAWATSPGNWSGWRAWDVRQRMIADLEAGWSAHRR